MFIPIAWCLLILGYVAVWLADRPKPPPPVPRPLTEEELALADAMSHVAQLEDELARKRARAASDHLCLLREVAQHEERVLELQRLVKRADWKKGWLENKISDVMYTGKREQYRLVRIKGDSIFPSSADVVRRLAAYMDELDLRLLEVDPPANDTWARRWGGMRG
jgi:hypothetical protein